MLKITFPFQIRYLVIQFHYKSYRITICKTCKAIGRKWCQKVSVCIRWRGYNYVGFQNASSRGACALWNNSFIESHVTSYNKIHVKNPILFWMWYLCFINVNLALMSTETIMMVCLHFCKLFLQWTFTILRLYQVRLFDLKSQFCGSYVCLYSECGQTISWLLTSADRLSFPTRARLKQSKERISWAMSVYKSQEHELLKLDNISFKKLYAGKFNIILLGVMARLQNFNFIYWKALCLGICFPGSCMRCTVVSWLYVVWSDWERYFE